MSPASRPRTILIDASDIHRPSGGRTAVLELFRPLLAREAANPAAWRYVILVSRHEPDFELPHVRQIVLPFGRHSGSLPRPAERLWIQAVVSYLALTGQVDLVHFARTMGGFAWPARSVLTIFDLTTVLWPELHSRSAVWYWRHVAPLHLRHADRVVAISQDVADGLVQHYGLSPAKIEVVYCAPHSAFDSPPGPHSFDRLSQKHGLEPGYLLFLGILAKKKNLPTLIQAMHLLKAEGLDVPPLILAGRRYRQSDDSAILAQICNLGLEDTIRYLGPVADEELPGLYTGARALLFPSLHEGFGIPCVEAMKCGVPVIAARSGAIPEVTGDAAILVDQPADAAASAGAFARAFAVAIRSLLEDEALCETLIARGRARAAEFSWNRSAGQVLDLYRSLLEEATGREGNRGH
jgi:glycosyltransferase involved in cell wall biosynthesis